MVHRQCSNKHESDLSAVKIKAENQWETFKIVSNVTISLELALHQPWWSVQLPLESLDSKGHYSRLH